MGPERAIEPTHADGEAPHADEPPKLDRAVQARIGEQLRAMYDDLLQAPVPQRFLDLLARLDDTGDTDGTASG